MDRHKEALAIARLRAAVLTLPHLTVLEDTKILLAAHDRYEKALEKISQMDEMRLVAADDGGGYLVCRYCGEVSDHNEDCPISIAEDALCD